MLHVVLGTLVVYGLLSQKEAEYIHAKLGHKSAYDLSIEQVMQQIMEAREEFKNQ